MYYFKRSTWPLAPNSGESISFSPTHTDRYRWIWTQSTPNGTREGGTKKGKKMKCIGRDCHTSVPLIKVTHAQSVRQTPTQPHTQRKSRIIELWTPWRGHWIVKGREIDASCVWLLPPPLPLCFSLFFLLLIPSLRFVYLPFGLNYWIVVDRPLDFDSSLSADFLRGRWWGRQKKNKLDHNRHLCVSKNIVQPRNHGWGALRHLRQLTSDRYTHTHTRSTHRNRERWI